MSRSPALVDVEDVRTRVDAVLTGYVARLRELADGAGRDCAPLADAVDGMLAGGKRLRAAFCYWSWRAHGGDPGTDHAHAVIAVGAALELFQAAALFHDDVIDDSDMRRGRPAAHRAFAGLHERSGWSGDSRRFGDATAILLGDLALVLSGQAVGEAVAHESAERRARVHGVFDHMCAEVTVGQYLDVLAQALPWGLDPAADEARAREVIRSKSARYSVEHPIVLGAALAGADDDALAACRAVGLPLGEAFQLRDDLLGVFGDPATTGKPAGDDLREGKRTVLVARAMARSRAIGDQATVALLLTGLGHRDLDDAQIAALATAIDASRAPDDVEELIGELSGHAFAGLASLALVEPGRTQLERLAHAAVDRRS